MFTVENVASKNKYGEENSSHLKFAMPLNSGVFIALYYCFLFVWQTSICMSLSLLT